MTAGRRKLATLVLLGPLLSTGACALLGEPTDEPATQCADGLPPRALPTPREGALALVPQQARPGQEFVAKLPARRDRPMRLTVDSKCESYSITVEDFGPQWTPIPREGSFLVDMPIQDTDSVPGVVPDTATPGSYLVCADDGLACAWLDVVG